MSFTSTIPPTMRAWTFSSRGLPREILKLDPSHPVPPPPTAADLLIRVSHVGLNPGSLVNMAMIPPFVRRVLSGGRTTWIAEGDFSGVVFLAGPDAPAALGPGTAVFGNVPVPKVMAGIGTLAEYIVMPATSVAVVPPEMHMSEAGGLSGAAQTALDMISELKMKEGHRIFVNGGSGGVGIMAVQLAKASGAYVVATCSSATADLVKQLGADEVVDYRAHSPLHAFLAAQYGAHPFDFILDTIGKQDLFVHSPQYLKPAGCFVNVGVFEGPVITQLRSMLNIWLPQFLGGIPRRYSMISVMPNGEKAAYLARMVQEGQLKLVVDDVIPFEDVLEGYDRMAKHNAHGKIIVKVQGST